MKRNSILFCLLLAITANTFTKAKAQAINTTDSLALVDLYNSTNGPNWYDHTNWLTTNSVSTWYGITTAGNRVITIELPYNNLVGPLPASISNLTSLTNLGLATNHLSGTLPASITSMYNLQYLFLPTNNFTGTIPAAIGNLTNLLNLTLAQNALTGSIPASITSLQNITDIDLSQNNLNGSIPQDIFNNKILKSLSLSKNKLTGAIPSTVGNATALSILYLNVNQLQGSIPLAIGNLTNLNYLSLNNNHLTGEIPYKMGKLTKLIRLYLSHNSLTGNIPNSFKNLTNLYTLDVSYNQLTHTNNDNNPFAHERNVFFLILYHNDFTFNGLELIAQKVPRAQYAPQANIELYQTVNGLAVSAGGTLSNNTYKWYITGQSNPVTIIEGDSTFTPTISGNYYAQITNSIATQLTLTTDTLSYIAAQKSTNIASLAKTSNTHFSIYPNPAKDIIHVKVNGTATIVLTNSAGKILFLKNINNDSEINVSRFANGTYYIQNKTTGETQKIVVVH